MSASSAKQAAKTIVRAGGELVGVEKVPPRTHSEYHTPVQLLTSPLQKYTVQSHGVWERIRRAFAVDPNRSNGVPLNPQFRNPTPGGTHNENYTDPVTIPAGDIAENPYWKRDIRRSYPKLSVIGQADVVGLLQLGSKASPRADMPLIGEEGSKQLVAAKEEGEKGLAAYFGKDAGSVGTAVLGPDGLPPTPSGHFVKDVKGQRAYKLEGDIYGPE